MSDTRHGWMRACERRCKDQSATVTAAMNSQTPGYARQLQSHATPCAEHHHCI